jgi:hypothetical protein
VEVAQKLAQRGPQRGRHLSACFSWGVSLPTWGATIVLRR